MSDAVAWLDSSRSNRLLSFHSHHGLPRLQKGSGGKAHAPADVGETMNRHKPRERLLFGCLLVALMVGVVAVKFWVVSVEERLAAKQAIQQINLNDDKTQTNVLYNHERRMRVVEHTAWAVWDHHAPCDGWPTQQQIAQGE